MDDAPAATGVDDARKTAMVQAEVQRMKCLPPSSAYAIHRLKVLNKMLQLLSKVRSSCALTLCFHPPHLSSLFCGFETLALLN
jgi:hypothetical protein